MWLVGVVSRREVWVVEVGGTMGVVSRRWVWVESVDVVSWYGCKEVYRFHLITYPPTPLVPALILQHRPYLLFTL